MDQIESIIRNMTLEEKAGQMLAEDFVGRYSIPDDMVNALEKGHVGTVSYFSGCNVVNSYQLKNLTKMIQEICKNSHHKIPAFVTIDQEGGQLSPIPRDISIHPGNMALAAISENGEYYAEEMGKITGQELKTIGINVNLAPVVDLSHEEGLPVKDNRYFGSNCEVVGKLGAAFAKGLQENGVIACAKHFPGQRNVDIDSHKELDIIPYDKNRLLNVELMPFRKTINAGVEMVMTLHASYTALDPTNTPATLSKPIITGLLRKEFGFNGIVISDDLQMEPIMVVYGLEGAIIKSINAGVDLIIISKNQREAYQIIVDAVKKGMIEEQTINESMMRILKAKKKYADFDFDDDKKTKQILCSAESKKKVEETADKSITLIRNKKDIFPLKIEERTRVSIIRPTYGRLVMSDNTNFYTHNFVDFFKKYCDDVSEYVCGIQPNDVERLGISDWGFMCDYTIFCTYNAYQYREQLNALEDLRKLTDDDSIILVALRSPVDINFYPKEIPTVIATYGVTEASVNSLAKLVFGKIKAEGKLPLAVHKFDNI